ncbi:sensor histidine kinase [Chiayiivirga flava]|uniref:Signal transduction histidine kinase n=1 Tax=Chiayiivirga flava TaxID=659595 RepID=A0A7W8G277_9GAMM|nr:histidine kinase [Chiayiivirga flava]MBB5209663.1 signal transduction histidine kinase [Chiayiivirga flava]
MDIRLGNTTIGLRRYLALWTVVVLVFALQSVVHDAFHGHTWSIVDYLRWSMIQWYTWAALAPLVFRLGQRYPLQAPLRMESLGTHALASAGVTLLSVIAGALVSTLFEPTSFSEQFWQFAGKHVGTGLMTYWALLAMQQALHYQAEKARREMEASRLATELAQSRLQVLKTQLQPHFLFNTLHAIVTLLDEDKVSAEDMLLRLSDLLRAFLEDYDGQEITLRRELELLDLYLGIQRMRFKDRLTTRVYVAPDTLDCAVPSLLLQPIVENAIRHGIGRRVGSDCIEIESRREDGMLCIDVRNRNSVLGDGDERDGHGIGLSNTRLRLKELHGDAAQIRLDMMVPEGVACRIRLPVRSLDETDDAPEHAPA